MPYDQPDDECSIHRAIEEYTLDKIAKAITDVGLPEILDAHDRCDRCGSQAYVALCLPGKGTTLKFCGHHYRKHEAKLLEQEFIVLTDERDRINVKPSPSASVD